MPSPQDRIRAQLLHSIAEVACMLVSGRAASVGLVDDDELVFVATAGLAHLGQGRLIERGAAQDGAGRLDCGHEVPELLQGGLADPASDADLVEHAAEPADQRVSRKGEAPSPAWGDKRPSRALAGAV